MNMRMLLLIGCMMLVESVVAQSGDLMVQGTGADMFLEHTVAPKENWYSIGRIYNISPKEIAPFNGLALETPLSIGQQVKIPLTNNNFATTASKADDELFVPVYHLLQEKEWLFRVSSNYKVPVENLEKWNGISNDQVKPGMKLIVGYLKVKKDLSYLASSGSATIKTGNGGVAVVSKAPAATSPATSPATPVKTTTEELPAKPATPVGPAKTESTMAVKPEPPKKTPPMGVSVSGGGYFAGQYSPSGKNSNGNAAIFKSTSGWQDGKYYALMNNVPVGTIVRIGYNGTGKSVYAKVLGPLSEIKENNGLQLRLSDAAASGLGADIASRFPVEVKY